ncbi:glycerol dehydrogenase Gld1 [Schizosaccharomyces japonicus yFS275]|uniref:Glycerol dehydrogenase Gld1 n=1 Tax=Schizosaccharomyces japonicus (strain yFS275 / FY16936) TaxID=402676 RepID=B6K5S2_SCHJY|nr:glycerol dehydrogenase Gld1 [Schizosaccharomyces japonicus yFS275]EEB08876.1 glycerol dehydrogenase Gld1 [Schizosaccharomyces japonicus yFS275]
MAPLTSEVDQSLDEEALVTKQHLERVYTSIQKYVQGPGVFERAYTYVRHWATESAMIIADERVWEIGANKVKQSLVKHGLRVTDVTFGGEASEAELERICTLAESGTELIIGVGGGKTMDTAKYVANKLHLPCVIAPSTASSDAATSSLSVIYTPDGQFQRYSYYPLNPNMVMVDTKVIVQAPVRFLISGVGDALATWIEAESVINSHATSAAGGTPTIVAAYIGRACMDSLRKYAVQGILSNIRHACTDAFEATVEANTLLSGLGFENAGLAAAHAVHNGLTVLGGPIHQLMHGEKVAYGTLVQLVLENRTLEEYFDIVSFMAECHLPITLEELGLEDISDEDLLKVGEAALKPDETIHNMSKKFSPGDIADAIRAADAYSKKWRQVNNWTEKFIVPPSRHHAHVQDIHP